MRVKVTCTKIYDTDDLMEEFIAYQDDYPLTFESLEEFILDRFINPNFDNCDVKMEVQP